MLAMKPALEFIGRLQTQSDRAAGCIETSCLRAVLAARRNRLPKNHANPLRRATNQWLLHRHFPQAHLKLAFLRRGSRLSFRTRESEHVNKLGRLDVAAWVAVTVDKTIDKLGQPVESADLSCLLVRPADVIDRAKDGRIEVLDDAHLRDTLLAQIVPSCTSSGSRTAWR